MKIDAEIVETSRKTVNVCPKSVLIEIKRQWMKSINRPAYQYINSKLEWEDWEDCHHGSGIYTQHGKATEQEVEVFNAFKLIEFIVKGLK